MGHDVFQLAKQRMSEDFVMVAYALDQAVILGLLKPHGRIVANHGLAEYDSIRLRRGEDLPTEQDCAFLLRMLALRYYRDPDHFNNDEPRLSKMVRGILDGRVQEWVKHNPPQPGECSA